MREIEVKAKADNLDIVSKKLKNMGCRIGEEIVQEDRIYGLPKDSDFFNEIRPEFVAIRVRKEKNRTLFTIKRNITGELDSEEFEVEVSDHEEMDKALKAMGYIIEVEVKKRRRTCKVKDYELCLDAVENLGSFIEAEKFADDDEDGTKVQRELFDFLETLGIDREDEVTSGYDTMMLEKNKKRSNS
jgi:adenylate cyclase class 2